MSTSPLRIRSICIGSCIVAHSLTLGVAAGPLSASTDEIVQPSTAFSDRTEVLNDDCGSYLDGSIGDPGFDGIVWSLAVLPTGDLVAGGTFTIAGGKPARGVARWDGTEWHAVGDLGGSVRPLAVDHSGDIIAGGTLLSSEGQQVPGVLRWDGTEWHPLGEGMNDGIFALAIMPNGDVIAGGRFTLAGGIAADRVARWDGESWSSMGAGLNGQVWALAVFDDGLGSSLYAGGEFTMSGGEPVRYVAKWTGSQWENLQGGQVSHAVRLLHVSKDIDDPSMFVAGNFNTVDESPFFMRSAIRRNQIWEPMGTLFPYGSNDDIIAAAYFSGRDGEEAFASLGDAYRIVWWRGSGWEHLLLGANFHIRAMVTHDDGSGPALYFAGQFNSAWSGSDDVTANRIARWYIPTCPDKGIHHVPGDFKTIQEAIDAASDGDKILVMPGEYSECIDFAAKTITLESVDGPEVTTINATGLEGPAVYVGAGSSLGTTLRGFRITGASSESDGHGVLVESADLWIDRCIISENGGEDISGGGLRIDSGADVYVTNCIIRNNEAWYGGGVGIINNKLARFFDCVIENNVAVVGAGIDANTASRSIFIRCDIQNNAAEFGGGGLYVTSSGSANYIHLSDCRFIENTAESYGGGARVVGNTHSWHFVHRCTFERNATAGYGGAGSVHIDGYWRDCIIEGNTAKFGGGFSGQRFVVIDSLLKGNFAEEEGGAIHGAQLGASSASFGPLQ